MKLGWPGNSGYWWWRKHLPFLRNMYQCIVSAAWAVLTLALKPWLGSYNEGSFHCMPHHSVKLLDALCLAPTRSASFRKNVSKSTSQKKAKFLEFSIFLITKLGSTSVICLSVTQSTLRSISECLQMRQGLKLPVSSCCSAMSFFALVPDQLVAFKEMPICCAVVH